jgi:S1-C subfamily serine protease
LRQTVVVAILSALIGAGVAAGAVMLLDDDEGGDAATRTVVQQAPLARGGGDGDDGGLTPAEIYERDAPGVVFITAEVVRSEQSPFDVFPTEQRGESTGTGFVIDDKGSILTNAHVVENARRVTVRFSDGKTVPARLRGSDPSTDLALLLVDPEQAKLRPLTLGSSDEVEVGDPTVAIGNPFGLDLTLTTGVISAKQRRLEAPNGFQIDDVLQTDAAINPGNSGGPLIDAAGRVIGVNSQIRTGGSGGGSIGLGFAVPIDTAKRVVPELRRKGRVDRAYLGVTSAEVPGGGTGAVVADLVPGGPADDAGIMPTDVIVSIDGKPVRSPTDVGSIIEDSKPGQTVPVEVRRDGQTERLEVELEQRPDAGALDTVGP